MTAVTEEPLIKSLWSLRNLARVLSRRQSQLMALVLGKIANAESARARQRPSGLTGILADGVALIRRATSPTQSRALPAMIPVSQSPQGLDQGFPRTRGPSGIDLFARIADQISRCGYVTLTDFLPQPLLHALFTQVRETDEGAFKRAGIGRDSDFHINNFVRGDRILWVSEQDDSLKAYFDWMEDLRLYLNRELLLGLFDYECHYAFYPENAFYKKHVDAFRGRSNRRLSTVLYLNPAWQPDNGGELVLYSEDGSEVLETIAPSFGRMVFFLSEVFPHEVLPTKKARYSLTGWFRVNAAS